MEDVKVSRILQEFLILKILKEHPQITSYEINRIMRKLHMAGSLVTEYYYIRDLTEEHCIIITGRAERLHGIVRRKKQCPRSSNLLEITSEGIKRLIYLENMLRIALSLTLNGVTI